MGFRDAVAAGRDPLNLLCWLDAQASAPYAIGIPDDAHGFGDADAEYSYECHDYPWEVVREDDHASGAWEGFLGAASSPARPACCRPRTSPPADRTRRERTMDLDEPIRGLLAAALEGGEATDVLGSLVSSLPAATAARALAAVCDGRGTDWRASLGDRAASAVDTLLAEPEPLRVATPYGDLVARAYDDSGTYMGVVVDLEKPDGTSGQVSMTEVVAEFARDAYPTPVHTFAWDGVREDCVAETDLHPDGPEMGYPYRSDELSKLEGRQI